MLNRCWGGGDFGFECMGLVVQGEPRVESMQEALGSITVVAEAKRGHETGQEVSRVRRGRRRKRRRETTTTTRTIPIEKKIVKHIEKVDLLLVQPLWKTAWHASKRLNRITI